MAGSKFIYAGILVLVLAVGFFIGTYAYYSNDSLEISESLIVWDCNSENNGKTESFSISLGDLSKETSGVKTIMVKSTIDADYEIKFLSLNNYEMSDSTLKFYKTNNFIEENEIMPGTILNGSVAADSSSTVNFWYNWLSTIDKNLDEIDANIMITCNQK